MMSHGIGYRLGSGAIGKTQHHNAGVTDLLFDAGSEFSHDTSGMLRSPEFCDNASLHKFRMIGTLLAFGFKNFCRWNDGE